MSQAAPTTSTTPAAAPRRPAGPPAPRGRQTHTIDPVRVLRQHAKWLVAATVAGAILGGVAYVVQYFVYPVWSGQVVFEIRPDIKDVTAPGKAELTEEVVQRVGQTEARRILSKNVLDMAMKAPDIKNTVWGTEYPTVDERVEELEKTMRAGHLRGTSHFVLTWSTQHKADVPVILNQVANTYMEMRRASEESMHAKDVSSFQDKRRRLDEDIRKQTEAMQKFIGDHGISDRGESNPHSELRRKIESTSAMRDEAIRAVAALEQRRLQIDQKIATGVFEEQDRRRAMDDYAVKQAQQILYSLEVGARARAQRFGPDHPAVRDANASAAAGRHTLEQEIRDAMLRNLNADKIDCEESMAQQKAVVAKFSEDLAADQRRLEELTMRSTELSRMTTELKNLESERELMQKMIAEAELMRVRQDAQRVQLLQSAVTPREMSFPKLQYYVPLGAILLLGLTAGIIFLREFLDQRVRQPSDLVGIPGCKLLGVVPDLSEDPAKPATAERVVQVSPGSVTAEMFRQVAAQVRKTVAAGGHRLVAVVSAHPAAGTTTLISNLALSAAASGKRVAVVDANFRRPGLARMFGVDPEAPGLGNMLKGEKITPAVVDGVTIYPTGPASVRVVEMLSSDHMERVLNELRGAYDLVLLDLPPSLVAGESLIIVHASDASLLVVRAMQDLRGLVSKMVHQLLDTRATLLGCVLMRPEHTAGGYFKKNAELMAEYATEEQKAA